MSIISYKCDTCKKDLQLIENVNGLTTFSNCVITDGCRGTMHATSRNQDSIRPLLNPTELTYTPRKVFYHHIQDTPMATWSIPHGMNVIPSISVYIDGREINKSEYEISVVSQNELNVSFNDISSGSVHLVARSSNSTINKLSNDNKNYAQISNRGVLTFAFPYYVFINGLPVDLSSNVDVELEVILSLPGGEDIICIETIENKQNLDSPWFDWHALLLRNRRDYIIRSKSILDFKLFEDPTLTLSDIKTGTTLKINRIKVGNGALHKPEPREALILGSYKPHTANDKMLDYVIDSVDMLDFDIGGLVWRDTEFQFPENSLDGIYPQISESVDKSNISPPPSPTPSVTPSAPTVTPTGVDTCVSVADDYVSTLVSSSGNIVASFGDTISFQTNSPTANVKWTLSPSLYLQQATAPIVLEVTNFFESDNVNVEIILNNGGQTINIDSDGSYPLNINSLSDLTSFEITVNSVASYNPFDLRFDTRILFNCPFIDTEGDEI